MLLIFDLDGVILSASVEKIFEAYQEILTVEGKDWRSFFTDLKSFKKWWNPVDRKYNDKRMGLTDIERAHKIFYRIYNPCVHFLQEMEFVVRQLATKHDMAILTSRHVDMVMNRLDSVIQNFTVVVDAGGVKKLKPDPEGVNFILMQVGFWEKKKEAVMIDDTPQGISAGFNAGIKTAAVIWENGIGIDEDFASLDFKPDYIIRKPEDFLEKFL